MGTVPIRFSVTIYVPKAVFFLYRTQNYVPKAVFNVKSRDEKFTHKNIRHRKSNLKILKLFISKEEGDGKFTQREIQRATPLLVRWSGSEWFLCYGVRTYWFIHQKNNSESKQRER